MPRPAPGRSRSCIPAPASPGASPPGRTSATASPAQTPAARRSRSSPAPPGTPPRCIPPLPAAAPSSGPRSTMPSCTTASAQSPAPPASHRPPSPRPLPRQRHHVRHTLAVAHNLVRQRPAHQLQRILERLLHPLCPSFTPLAPLASSSTVSFVDVSPSIEIDC